MLLEIDLRINSNDKITSNLSIINYAYKIHPFEDTPKSFENRTSLLLLLIEKRIVILNSV